MSARRDRDALSPEAAAEAERLIAEAEERAAQEAAEVEEVGPTVAYEAAEAERVNGVAAEEARQAEAAAAAADEAAEEAGQSREAAAAARAAESEAARDASEAREAARAAAQEAAEAEAAARAAAQEAAETEVAEGTPPPAESADSPEGEPSEPGRDRPPGVMPAEEAARGDAVVESEAGIESSPPDADSAVGGTDPEAGTRPDIDDILTAGLRDPVPTRPDEAPLPPPTGEAVGKDDDAAEPGRGDDIPAPGALIGADDFGAAPSKNEEDAGGIHAESVYTDDKVPGEALDDQVPAASEADDDLADVPPLEPADEVGDALDEVMPGVPGEEPVGDDEAAAPGLGRLDAGDLEPAGSPVLEEDDLMEGFPETED